MDAGTQLPIEYLKAGSVLNAHHFLVQRKHSVNVRFNMSTAFYYLKYARMVEVARKYPAFAKELIQQKGKAASLKSRD